MNKFLLTLGAVAISATAFATDYRIVGEQLTAEQMLALPADSKVVVRTHARGAFGWWKAVTTNEETGEGYFIHRDTELAQNNSIFPEEYVYTVTVNDNSFTFKNAFGRYLPKAETKNNNTTFSSNVTDPAEAESLSIITNPAIQDNSTCAGMYVFRASTTCSGQSHSDLHLENSGDYCIPKFYTTAAGGLQQPSDNVTKSVAATALYLVKEIDDNIIPEANFPGLVSRESCATDIVDGAVIALQAKDTNGGLNYFFNGPAVKSPTLGYNQLYQVIGKEDGTFILKRLSDNTYVGKTNNDQTSVEDEADAAPFTAAPASLTGWTTKPAAVDPATAPTIRFTTNGTFLNCRDKGGRPAFATGTGGYSGWFVYTFTPEQVEKLRAAADDTFTTGNIFEGLAGKKAVVAASAATELTQGWYVLHNVGRNGYAKQENAKLYMRHLPNEIGAGDVEEFAPYMFYVEPNPYPYYDNNNKYAIRSVYGDYFHLTSNNVSITSFPLEVESAPISGSTDNFYLKDVATGYILNGTAVGTGTGNIVVGYGTDIPTSAGGNSAYQFFPVTLADELPVTVTVNLRHNGHILSTETVAGFAGDEVQISTPAFFNDNITVTIPEEYGQTINIDLQELIVPFKFTETTDNLIWQAIQIHQSYANSYRYTWTYSEADSNTMVEHEPADVATNSFADTQLWAFVGNMADGFKIYNKAAGTDMWVYGDDTHVKVGTGETKSVWKPYVNTVNLEDATYCCFKSDGTTYINLNVGADNATTLTYWGGADQGSCCWFTAACEPLLATAADYVFTDGTYNGPANAVGAVDNNGLDLSYGAEVVAAAQANKYDLEAAEALRDLIALYSANVTVNPFNANKFYRFLSINGNNRYVYSGSLDDNGADDFGVYGAAFTDEQLEANYHTLFSFEPVAGNANRYYVHSQGLYLGHTLEQQNVLQVAADGERGQYELANHGTAIFAIGDKTSSSQRHFLFNADNDAKHNVTGWGEWVNQSYFYLLPVETVNVALGLQHDKMNVGFGFFPFAVSATDDATKLYFIKETTDTTSATGAAIITYEEVSSVPANTAFMVSHSTGTTATLAIGAESAANARRRAIAAEGNNDVTDGFADTDNWTGTSWTKCDGNVPAQIAALDGVNADNVRYMQRTMTFDNGGDLTADFVYTSGNDRLETCGLELLDAEGNLVNGDFHVGYSGTYKVNKVYSVKVPTAGTYTVRYYAYNADNALNTNGNINITFIAKDNTNILHGYLRQNQAQAGDYVLGTTATGIGFVKVNEPTDVAGNYVYIPASNLYDKDLIAADVLPLANNDSTTGISDINAEQPAAAKAIYDLQGRRLSAPVKGLNIINGAKVLVK